MIQSKCNFSYALRIARDERLRIKNALTFEHLVNNKIRRLNDSHSEEKSTYDNEDDTNDAVRFHYGVIVSLRPLLSLNDREWLYFWLFHFFVRDSGRPRGRPGGRLPPLICGIFFR